MIQKDEASSKALYAAQEKFLSMLNDAIKDKDTLGRSIVLCGGTALSRCYLHHRISYDLDFFVDGEFNPEKFAVMLGKKGIQLDDVQYEKSGDFVYQLFGFSNIDGVKLKVSFIEDSYPDMFPCSVIAVGNAEFNVETIEGLYHRKLRTITGSGYGDRPTDGRQTARDLFDLYMLDLSLKPIPEFIVEINKLGANFPEKAFLSGLSAMPWIDMMDEFEQLDLNASNPHLKDVRQEDVMSLVRSRAHEIFKEMTNG